MTWHIDTADTLPPLLGADGLPEEAALALLEARLPVARPTPPDGPVRVMAWRTDVEPSPDDAARLLRTSEPAIALLTMREAALAPWRARVMGSVASRLGAGHVLALLNLGPAEAGATAIDTVGLVSPYVLFKLGLERLPSGQDGGRSSCAVLAQLVIEGVDVTFASVALDADAGPDRRARQMVALLDSIDGYDRYLPVLIGGDLATTTFTSVELADAGRMRLVLHKTAQRLLLPAAHEPMFHVLRKRGYDWRAANVPLAPTGRSGPPGVVGDQLYKRMWFFTRGLSCDDPVVIPALDGAGRPMGSHDAISLRIRPG